MTAQGNYQNVREFKKPNCNTKSAAIAHTAGIELTLNDFETIRARVPVLCNLKPNGRYVATLHKAGGIP